jgi:hypothetical protein
MLISFIFILLIDTSVIYLTFSSFKLHQDEKIVLKMSKQNSLDKYFVKRKENNEKNTLTKKRRLESKNIITQSNTIASQLDHSTVNNTSTSDIQSIDNNSITSKTIINTYYHLKI